MQSSIFEKSLFQFFFKEIVSSPLAQNPSISSRQHLQRLVLHSTDFYTVRSCWCRVMMMTKKNEIADFLSCTNSYYLIPSCLLQK